MKRLISIVLCAFLGLTIFGTGCASRKEPAESGDMTVSEEQSESAHADWPDGTIQDLSQFDVSQYSLDNFITPIWADQGIARCETVFVVQEQDGSIAPISLLYPAKQIVSVRTYGLDIRYEEGKDYTLTSNGKLQIVEGGAIQSMPHDEFYLSVYDPSSSANLKEIYGDGAQIYTEAMRNEQGVSLGMTEWQIAVTYSHSAIWKGSVPTDQSENLLKTNTTLKQNGTLKIACLGDSISQGWTASGYENVDILPQMPPYIELFKAGLQSKFESASIELENFAIAGKTSRWPLFEEDGIANFENLLKYKPDLVILAFGMNDGGDISPADFSSNMEDIIDKILDNKADTEIVLVSSMLPNQEIRASWGERGPMCNYHPAYKAVLQRISSARQQEGESVVFADVLSVNQQILEQKEFRDITSNNTNHPNDYMHRIYAQVLMRTVMG